jgi:SAM-dependent methyltransferase
MLKDPTSADVKKMYENHPYPSGKIDDNLIYDLAAIVGMTIDIEKVIDAKILDVGCGTGHRLIGFASCYPQLQFVGLDMTQKSIETAKKLAEFHDVHNVSFINDKIENYKAKDEYDFIVSTGVLHHMEDPTKGFSMINRALKNDGIAILWLYHAIGEYDRMIKRDLVQIFSQASTPDNYYLNINILEKLDAKLNQHRYGNKTTQNENGGVDQKSLDVDAYLHPIVRTYYYNEIKKMALNSGFYISFCLGFNKEGSSKIIDVHNQSNEEIFLKFKDIYMDKELNCLYEKLSYDDKVKSLELSWKPTGITVAILKSKVSLNKIECFAK